MENKIKQHNKRYYGVGAIFNVRYKGEEDTDSVVILCRDMASLKRACKRFRLPSRTRELNETLCNQAVLSKPDDGDAEYFSGADTIPVVS